MHFDPCKPRISIGALAWLFLMLPFAATGLAEEANLVRNGDFSPALENWTMNDGGGSCAVRMDPQTRCGEKNSVLLRCEKPGSQTAGFLECKPFAVRPAQIYLLEFNVKGKDIPRNTPGLVTARFYASSQPNAGIDWVKAGQYVVGAYPSSGPGPGGSLPFGSFDWQPYRYYLRAYNATDLATLRFSPPPTGSLWISGVRVTLLPIVRGLKCEVRDGDREPGIGDPSDGYLTDGYFYWSQGKDNQKLGRAYHPKGPAYTLSISFPRVTKVDRLVLVLQRYNETNMLKRIEVYCNKVGRRVKVAEGPGYLTEEFHQPVWIIEAPVEQTTDAIELKLVGDTALVPFQVLAVAGETGKTEEMRKGEEMKRYLLAGWFVLAAATTAPAAQEPVVLENEYVRMEFQPVEGGVCKRLLYKPANKELVYAYPSEGAGYGLFRDRFWAPTERDYADVVYQHEETKTANGRSIHLWGRGAGGIYGFTEVHKTITLTNGSPLIRAEYEIKNNLDSMTDADYGFWLNNFLGVLGGKNLYFIPTTAGIMEVSKDPIHEPPDQDLWVKNPARGWMAGIGEGRTGIAWSVEYKYLDLFYQWLSGAVPTSEWQYNRITVPCGQSFKTEVTLMPFTGLDRVDGFFKGTAGSLALPANVAPGGKATPEIALVADGDRKLTLKFRTRLLPATAWTELGSKDVEFKTAAVQTVAWPQEMTLPAGTTVVNCELLESGQPIGSLERPMVVGAPSGEYALAPECPQVGSKEPLSVATGPTIPEHKLSMEVVTPHVEWAKPYAKGPIKALILADCGRQREIVELMERFDLQVETEKLFFDTTYDAFNEKGDISVRSPAEAQARLKKKLQQPFDVIMIAGLHWSKTFDDEARKAILSQVKAGAGLVYVGPIGLTGELKDAWPFATGERKTGTFGFVETRRKHFITAGIPCDLLPPIYTLAYAGQVPAGSVLLAQKASPKELPVLSTGSIGKGRAVCFFWDVYPDNLIGEGSDFSRITPLTPNDNDLDAVMKDRRGRTITWRYWDYFFSLAGRSLLWAANREPDLAVELAGRDEKGDVTGAVECPDEKRPAVLEMTFRNKFSEEEKAIRQNVDLVQGQNSFRFTPPGDLMAGITLTDLRVLTPDGKVIAWASGYYETKPSLEIAALELEKPILPPRSEVVRGRVKLSGAPGPENSLEVTVTDFYGRMVARQTAKAAGPLVPFEAHLLDVLSIPMTVEVRLMKGAQLLDRRAQTVLFLRERTWDPKECCQYEWYNSPFPGRRLPYLYDFGRHLISQVGVTSIMDNPGIPEYIRLDAEANTFTSPLGFWDISDPKFSEKANAYAKTHDRKYLVREPCLWDPAYREKAKAAMHKAAETAMPYGGGYSYCLSDEMTLTSYGAYYDFDFAPASIAAFRQWLQKRYGTLDALNREWATACKDWAEIEPMTLADAQKRENGNYAPWADFRTFMDDSMDDFMAYLQKSLEEADPQAKVSLSGTQDATAGTGLDWWKLSHTFKALHTYYVANTQYMLESFGRQTGLLVAPFANNACGRRSGPIQEARMWWCAFYECYGLSSLGMNNYFLPDLTLTETGHEARNYLAEVRGGIWALLRSARRDRASIALLYSQPSIQANTVLNRADRTVKVRDAWATLLHDSGLQFDFVAYAQVEIPDFLTKQGYKVLILPEALALSDKEAAAIKAFANAGGVVIADNSAGWMNEHCRTLKMGQLDDLFGLSADHEPYAAGKPKLTLKENWGALKAGESFAGFAPTGKVTTAKAAAVLAGDDPGASAIYRCPAGKGQTVYLNLSVVPYREERELGGRGETTFRQLIGGALALAGVRPEFAVEGTGKTAFHGHVVPFTDQDVRYLGIIREFTSAEPEDSFAIRLPGSFHVYDVRAMKYLGKAETINAVLYPGAAKLYALLPQEAGAPVLDCPTTAARGAKLTLTAGVPGLEKAWRVVRLEVCDPSGAVRPYCSGPRLLPPGISKIEVSFMLALNDPTGDWTVRAVELLSGKTTERKVAVKE